VERLVRLRDLRPTPSGGTVFLDLPDLLSLFDPDGHAWTWGFQRGPELVADESWDFNLPVRPQP
jgi:hypothetical protein